MQDEYSLSPEDVKWVLSNMNSSTDATGIISTEEQGLSSQKLPVEELFHESTLKLTE